MKAGVLLASVACVIGLSLASGQEAKPKPRLLYPESIPDPEWDPKPGERVTLNSDAPGSVSHGSYLAYKKSSDANDQTGIKQQLKSGETRVVAKGSEVVVLTYYGPGRPQFVPQTRSVGSFLNSLQGSGIMEERPAYPVEVRVTSGPDKDKVLFISDFDMARMIPNPRPFHESKVGDTVVVGVDVAWIAVDEASYLFLKNLPPAEREGGIDKAVKRGKAFRVKNGTGASVLRQFEFNASEPGVPQLRDAALVRVLSKQVNGGKSGLVLRSFLRPPIKK